MISSIIRRYAIKYARIFNVDREDLEQVGHLTATRCRLRYSPDAGATFYTYAHGIIIHSMLNYARRTSCPVSAHQSIFYKGEYVDTLRQYIYTHTRTVNLGELVEGQHSTFPAPDAATEAHEIADRLRAIIDTLPPRQNDIIKRLYGLGTPRETLKNIGARHGVSKQRIAQIAQEIIETLRVELEKIGIKKGDLS